MVLTRNDRLPRWPVKVNGVILQAILDSGAEHSVMSQATVERVGIQVNKSNEAIETSTGEICSVDVTQELIFNQINADYSEYFAERIPINYFFIHFRE